MGTTADELAFDRKPDEYRSAPFVEARRLDWAQTIARHVLYEAADEIRLEGLKASDDEEAAGLAAKMDREEAYHRIHAEMWRQRLHHDPQFQAALDELWPAAVAVLSEDLRPKLAERFGREVPADLS